jgi:hypothetical protein
VRWAPNKRPNKLSEVDDDLATGHDEVVTNEGEKVLWAGATKAPARDAAKASVRKLNFVIVIGEKMCNDDWCVWI